MDAMSSTRLFQVVMPDLQGAEEIVIGAWTKKSGDHVDEGETLVEARDRKSTRLNSSHSQISYAVFCLKKKTTIYRTRSAPADSRPLARPLRALNPGHNSARRPSRNHPPPPHRVRHAYPSLSPRYRLEQ